MNSMSLTNNFSTTTIEFWFIPVDILGITSLALAILLAIIYLCIIAFDKTCHTVRMILSGNICFTGLVCALTLLALSVFTFNNDFKQIQYQDSLCVIRGYFSYVSVALFAYSYVSSTMYQYVLIVYPTRLFWHSARTQLLLIFLGWILAFLFPIPFLFTGEIIYDVDNQICEVPRRLSLSMFYIPNFVFAIPATLVMVLYFKLVRYVKHMGEHLAGSGSLFRAQRDLAMVRRIVILLHIILSAGLPLTLFSVLSFFNRAPKYHSRIGYICVDVSLLGLMILLFQFTDSVKASVKKLIFNRRNTVLPVVTIRHNAAEKRNDGN